jgi:hypothetical protein
MTCDRYLESIHALADGTLSAAARQGLETHLAECGGCRRLAADLQRIRAVAASLDRLTPPPYVWDGIARRLETERRIAARGAREPVFGSRPARPLFAALAAAALVLAVTGSVVVVRYRADPAGTVAGANGSGSPGLPTTEGARLIDSIETELGLAEQHYDNAIKGLEQITKAEESSLDPQLAATLQKNLGVIDQAISESRAALRSQPGSTMAQESLFELLRRKMALLQDTITLINEMRKGDQAGAAEIVEGLSKS